VPSDKFEEYENVIALNSENEVNEKTKEEGDEVKCKFCWISDCSEEDPLIKACECKGGLAFIHLSCLRNW
jgi:E3 ubiquitin-protein ligase DOA10